MNDREPIRVVAQPNLGDQPITWYTYQRYYEMGLRMLPGVRFRHAKLVDQALGYVRERGWPGANAAWQLACRWKKDHRSERATHVGRYTIQFPGHDDPLRVAIDSHDGRHVRDPQAYDWSQVYFKVSRWPSLDYGPKVRPLIPGNGALSHARIARLIALRDRPRDLDLTFIAKLWPSSRQASTYWNSVEHLVRVFETLAKLKIRSHLRAIVVGLKGETFPQHFLDRLSRAGVPATTTNATADELWDATSRSQLAFLRPGRHLCVSWRMIDHLALGACTVCDHAAYPQWPVRLRPGFEFMDSDCGIGQDESLPDLADYARITDTVMDLLANPDRMAESRRASAQYFDRYVAPAQLARHLLDVCKERATALTPPRTMSISPGTTLGSEMS